jgi:hypothetical protein
MIYGKMKIELKYFLYLMFVLVTRKANSPPKMIDIVQVKIASNTVFKSGVHRFVLARRLVNRSI